MKTRALLLLLVGGALSLGAAVSPLALNDDPSFESDESNWNTPDWAVQTSVAPVFDTACAVEGKRSVRFDLEHGKMVFYWQSFNAHRGVKAYEYSGWVKYDKISGVRAVIRLELVNKENGKDTYYHADAKATGRTENGFAEYTGRLDVKPGTFAARIQIFVPKGGSGTVWVDNVVLAPAADDSDGLSLRNWNSGGDHGVYVRGETPELELVFSNGTKAELTPQLSVKVTDDRGKTVAELAPKVTFAPGEVKSIPIRLEGAPDCGFYTASVECNASGKAPLRRKLAFIVTAPPEKRDPFFGVTAYGAPNDMMPAVAKLGAGTVGYCIYPGAQTSKGVFDFKRYDKDLKLRRDLGFQILAIYNVVGADHMRPGWVNAIAKRDMESGAKGYSEEYFETYRDFAREAAKYLKDKVDGISIANEIDQSQYMNAFEHDGYIRLVSEAGREFKKSAPNLPVASIGVASPDFNANPPLKDMKHFWGILCKDIDMIGFDGYMTPNYFGEGRTATTPEANGYRDKLLEVVRITKAAGKKEFAMDEAGWGIVSSTPLDSRAWLDLAAVLERTYIISKSVPEMKYYLYFKVINGERIEDWYLFGEGGKQPTAGAAAFGVVAHTMAFASEPEVIMLHKDLQSYLFSQNGKTLLTLWSTAPGGTSFKMILPSEAELTDYMGRTTVLKAGSADFMLTDRPLYFRFNAPRDSVRDVLKTATFTLPEVKISARRSGSDSVVVLLQNQQDAPLECTVTAGKSTGTASLKAREQKETLLTGVFCDNAETAIHVQTQNHTYEWNGSLQAYAFSQEKPAVITMASAEFLTPVDAIPNQLWLGSTDLSAQICLRYDRSNLYVEAEVTDDIRIRERTGSRIWGSDCIQFAINPGNTAIPGAGYGPNDWEFALAQTPQGVQLYCYIAPNASGLRNKPVPQNVIACSVTDLDEKRTLYKAAIPWELLGMKAVPGTIFGFNVIVLDTDTNGLACNYWLGLSGGIANGKNPALFRKFILK